MVVWLYHSGESGKNRWSRESEAIGVLSGGGSSLFELEQRGPGVHGPWICCSVFSVENQVCVREMQHKLSFSVIGLLRKLICTIENRESKSS